MSSKNMLATAHTQVTHVQVEDLLREALVLLATLEQAAPAGVLERLLPKRFKQYQKGVSSRV